RTTPHRVCGFSLAIADDGPVWPPNPTREVVRWMKPSSDRIVIIVRTTNALPDEDPAPDLRWIPPNSKVDGMRADYVVPPRPIVAVRGDARGEPIDGAEAGAGGYFAAEYVWSRAQLPTEASCEVDRWCRLPALSSSAPSAALANALAKATPSHAPSR